VSRFAVTRIAGDHTIFIEEMNVAMPGSGLILSFHLRRFRPIREMFPSLSLRTRPTTMPGVSTPARGRPLPALA